MNDISSWIPSVLSRIFDDPEIQVELGERLFEIDRRIKWEAGPHSEEKNYLAFSPNYHEDLLPVTESLAEAMPVIPGWEFLGAKPKKNWFLRKVRFNEKEYLFDDWRYRLVMFKEGEFFDIDFFTFDSSMDAKSCNGLGVFLASSELGEKLFMNAIDRVNVEIRPEAGDSSIAIQSLYCQITDLFKRKL